MEAELNSPMVRLDPGESYNFDTEWFPTRADKDFQGVTDAGVILKPLHAVQHAGAGAGKIRLAGAFGVFFSGRLVAHFYEAGGKSMGTQPLMQVDPRNPVLLETTLSDPGRTGRISLHLVDGDGLDRGALGEVAVETSTGNQ
jgi:hypothetical protein